MKIPSHHLWSANVNLVSTFVTHQVQKYTNYNFLKYAKTLPKCEHTNKSKHII